MESRRPWPVWLICLFDMLLIGATLVVFALFHHVLPQQSDAPVQIMEAPALSTRQPATASSASILPAATPQNAAPPPTPSPTPAPGDFSATFPNYDTGADATISYQTDDIRIAITQDKYENATYYAADVWIRSIAQFQTAFAAGSFTKGTIDPAMPIDIADEAGALLAISGDYCSIRRSGVVIRNGTLYRESVSEDVCVLYADGMMETFYKDDFDLEAAVARGAFQSWSFGPKLLENGDVPQAYDGASKSLHTVLDHRDPRAAIGYYAPGHYCLLVVDGRQGSYSKGLTLAQMSELFLKLGCVDAYNLDGGQTAAMIFDSDVVNRPYRDGRVVSDIIYFAG